MQLVPLASTGISGMTEDTSWLPALMTLADHGGNWNHYLDAIYQAFCSDFVTSHPEFEHKRFALKRYPLVEGKEATFWHITTEGEVELERNIDLGRCERIRWPRVMIEAVGTERVRVWRNRRRTEERVVIALPDFSYIVVLAARGEYVLLWTAYCVMQQHRRRKLAQEYEAYKRNG